MANHANADRDAGTAPDISRYLRTEASGVPPLPPPLSPDGAVAGPALRDMQKALVERIADVDDDRRRGAAALMKAFNAHRTQVRARLKHHQLTFGFALGLPLLLLAAGLSWLTWASHERAQQQDTRLFALEAGLAGVQATSEADPAAALLTDLNQQVARVQELHAQLAADLEALRAAALTPEQVSSQVAGQLTPLLERLTALENRPVPPASAGNASPGKVVTGASEQAARATVAAMATELRREFTTGLGALRADLATLREQTGSGTVALQDATTALSIDPAPVAAGTPATAPAGAISVPAGEVARETAVPGAEGADPPEDIPAPPAGDAAQETLAPMLNGPTLRVADQSYALQLIGFHDPADLLDFIARHPLPAQVYSREEQLRGRPWHVLIHSLHPDLASATAAQAGLPPELAGMDLWIRALPADAELRVLQTSQ